MRLSTLTVNTYCLVDQQQQHTIAHSLTSILLIVQLAYFSFRVCCVINATSLSGIYSINWQIHQEQTLCKSNSSYLLCSHAEPQTIKCCVLVC